MRSTSGDRSSGRAGFTIVELAIVLIISSILIGFAVPRLQEAFQRREVTGVRDGIVLMAAQARARAMEQAETIEFRLDTDDSVAVILDSGDTIDILRFGNELGIGAEADSAVIRLCYTPRGFATTPCSTALGGPMDVVFSRGGIESTVEIWTLGQLRKQ